MIRSRILRITKAWAIELIKLYESIENTFIFSNDSFGNVIPIYTSDLLQHSSCWEKPLVRNTTNQCNKDYATSAQKLLNQNNNHMMTKAETTEWCRCDNMIQLSETFHLSIIAINYAKCVKTLYGSRIVPGKKYILSGGRHLIMWRSSLNYLAAAT